ncbi:hypothetical protein BBK14_33760 [Parafrankia soli]|uniref:Uncharacterized protein n=1 Tax=Parafrankia soli TaxID=2599596 RepID=A0A1S1QH64_9ACTN|nr:hypothetical protein [Parafrankia soli]OHV32929.1 hypothetical protein BBK14_33760 [Parafrankia soli]
MTRRNDERWYRAFWDQELLLPSVTTILGCTWAKGGIPYWSALEAARYAVENHDEIAELIAQDDEKRAVALAAGAPRRITNEAAELGKLFHRVADAQIRHQVLPLTEEEREAVAPFMATLDQFIEEMKPAYRWTEAKVYHQRLLYAGTADCGIEFGVPLPVVVRRKLVHTFPAGTLLVGDYKSGKAVYDEAGMQMTGYASCTHMDLRDETHTIVEMPKVEGGAVIHIRPDGYRVHGVMITPEMRAGWVHARRWFEALYHRAPASIGIGVRAGGLRVDDFTGIDIRVRNALATRGISTLADLEEFGRDKFLAIRYAGPDGVKKAREILAIEDRSWPLGPDEITEEEAERGAA